MKCCHSSYNVHFLSILNMLQNVWPIIKVLCIVDPVARRTGSEYEKAIIVGHHKTYFRCTPYDRGLFDWKNLVFINMHKAGETNLHLMISLVTIKYFLITMTSYWASFPRWFSRETNETASLFIHYNEIKYIFVNHS